MRFLDALAVLGLAPSATRAQAKDAYRALARECHPDRGGDRARWDQLQAAYRRALEELGRPRLCPACNGLKTITVSRRGRLVAKTCETCHGAGLIEAEE